jgi:hypothetical protein
MMPNAIQKLANAFVKKDGKDLNVIDLVMNDIMGKIVNSHVLVTIMVHAIHKLANALVVLVGLVFLVKRNAMDAHLDIIVL